MLQILHYNLDTSGYIFRYVLFKVCWWKFKFPLFLYKQTADICEWDRDSLMLKNIL